MVDQRPLDTNYPLTSKETAPSAPMLTPARALFISYLGLIFSGAFALMLPGSHHGNFAFIDALFMSTSAVCVTGLSVIDVGSFLTRQGQSILVLLIQLGGLGILTFTTWILMLSGRHLSVFERSMTASSYGSIYGFSLNKILHNVFLFTFLFEGLAIIILFFRWWPKFPASEALFISIFHSVSAFCNAGFSTFGPQNLTDWAADPIVNLVIMGLIIFGGLGFIVMSDITQWLKMKRQRRLTLHTRVTLHMTIFLIIAGAAMILILESRGPIYELPWKTKLFTAFFQSVTTRTAGFNTTDIGALTAPTLFIMTLLMIIGAAPGSTGGGIKVSTMAVLMALIRSQIRGRSSVELSRRKIPMGDVALALATTALYLIILTVGLLLLLCVQGSHHGAEAGQSKFFACVFECVSAMGTVGLTMNYTSDLTPIGRIIITTLMFCGRVGPISLALTLVGQSRRGRYEYPEESIIVC